MPKPYVPNDKWSQRAAKEGFRARSVYKLEELDERCHLLRSGMKVLDIGAAPGSWLQYASKRVGMTGGVLGLDLKPIDPVDGNVSTRVCDITDDAAVSESLRMMAWKEVDLVLSDIAPNTSGIRDVDQWRSIELNKCVIDIARRTLRHGGTLVMKVFRGRDFDAFLREVKAEFRGTKTISVHASRDRSTEVYLVCR